MRKYPLVTVISAFFNRENHVEDSIKSILAQTYPNLEILIINDASTDETLEKIKGCVSGDQRVKIIHNTSNKGLVKSLISTVKEAKGEFIAIHGSGDISLPDRLLFQAEMLYKNRELVVVGCYVKREMENGELQEVKREIPPYPASNLLIKSAFNHGEVMFKKAAYFKAGGYREFFKYAQDRDLWLRMIKEGEFGIVEKPLYVVKFIKNSVSKNPKKRFEQRLYSNYSRLLYLAAINGENAQPMDSPEALYYIPYGNFAKLEILLQTSDFSKAIIPDLEKVLFNGKLGIWERGYLISVKLDVKIFRHLMYLILRIKYKYIVNKAQKSMDKGPLEVFKILNR